MTAQIRYYVFRTRPVAQVEYHVLHAVTQREHPALVPSFKEQVIRRGVKRQVKRPWFPFYVFVGAHSVSEAWWLKQSINQLATDMGKLRPPIVGLLGYSGERLATLTDDNLVFLKELAEKGLPKVDLRTVSVFVPGKKIKVTEGPFRGFSGVVDSVTRDKVKALVEIFGRYTPIEFESDGVKAAGIKAA